MYYHEDEVSTKVYKFLDILIYYMIWHDQQIHLLINSQNHMEDLYINNLYIRKRSWRIGLSSLEMYTAIRVETLDDAVFISNSTNTLEKVDISTAFPPAICV